MTSWPQKVTPRSRSELEFIPARRLWAALLTGDKPQQASGNLLLDQLFGAEIVYVADRKDRDRILQETFDRAKKEGRKPYLVPYGGSNSTGALGYAFAIRELIDQNISADWIIFASYSGGTQDGLLPGERF